MGFPIRRGSKSIWLGDIFLSEDTPDLKCLRLRDPDKFIAGGIHRNPEAWEPVLKDHPIAETIIDWIRNKINIRDFSQQFKGAHKGSNYCSDFPPPKLFRSHTSCTKCSQFVSEEILKRVQTGAITV